LGEDLLRHLSQTQGPVPGQKTTLRPAAPSHSKLLEAGCVARRLRRPADRARLKLDEQHELPAEAPQRDTKERPRSPQLCPASAPYLVPSGTARFPPIERPSSTVCSPPRRRHVAQRLPPLMRDVRFLDDARPSTSALSIRNTAKPTTVASAGRLLSTRPACSSFCRKRDLIVERLPSSVPDTSNRTLVSRSSNVPSAGPR
jgi:hypothetical protein